MLLFIRLDIIRGIQPRLLRLFFLRLRSVNLHLRLHLRLLLLLLNRSLLRNTVVIVIVITRKLQRW